MINRKIIKSDFSIKIMIDKQKLKINQESFESLRKSNPQLDLL